MISVGFAPKVGREKIDDGATLGAGGGPWLCGALEDDEEEDREEEKGSKSRGRRSVGGGRLKGGC